VPALAAEAFEAPDQPAGGNLPRDGLFVH